MEELIALLKAIHVRMDVTEAIMGMHVRWQSEDDAKKLLENFTAIRQSLEKIEAALPAQEEVTNETSS